MGLQLSVAVRNAKLDAVEATTGASAKLQIFTGAAPANCAAVDSGTLLVEMSLPSDWMAAASSGSKAKLGTWSGTAAADGVAGHFRIKDNGKTTCHIQGSITLPGSGGDMTLDNTNITTNQNVSVNTFTITEGNA